MLSCVLKPYLHQHIDWPTAFLLARKCTQAEASAEQVHLPLADGSFHHGRHDLNGLEDADPGYAVPSIMHHDSVE